MAFAILVATFNAIVDPFGFYNLIRVDGFNFPKIEFNEKRKLLKAMMISTVRPEAVMLGSSRVASGIDPNHSAFNDLPSRYNLAIGGANIYIIRRYLQHAQKIYPLRRVIIGLDFFGFNVMNKSFRTANSIDNNLIVYADGSYNYGFKKMVVTSTLFSLNALSSSFSTLSTASINYTGHITEPLTGADQFYYEGELLNHKNRIAGYKITGVQEKLKWNKPPRKVFLKTENVFLNSVYLLGAKREYYFNYPDAPGSSLDEMREIIQICKRNHTDLRLFISPVHARLLEVIRIIGLWPVFEQWKRELVNITEQESGSEKEIVPIWDFSGYNSITTEDFPQVGLLMNYYYDPSHYRMAVGDMVLDRIFDVKQSRSKLPENFGYALTTKNIENILETTRVKQHNYFKMHTEDIQEIESMARKAKIHRDYFTLIGGDRPFGGKLVNSVTNR